MKTIVLKGDANSGKTTTLRILANTLLDDGAKKVYYPRKNESVENVKVLQYKELYIAFSSIGDSPKEVEKYLTMISNFNQTHKIDFLFIASRDDSKFLGIIESIILRMDPSALDVSNYFEFPLTIDAAHTTSLLFLDNKVDLLNTIIKAVGFPSVIFPTGTNLVRLIKFKSKTTSKYKYRY